MRTLLLVTAVVGLDHHCTGATIHKIVAHRARESLDRSSILGRVDTFYPVPRVVHLRAVDRTRVNNRYFWKRTS